MQLFAAAGVHREQLRESLDIVRRDRDRRGKDIPVHHFRAGRRRQRALVAQEMARLRNSASASIGFFSSTSLSVGGAAAMSAGESFVTAASLHQRAEDQQVAADRLHGRMRLHRRALAVDRMFAGRVKMKLFELEHACFRGREASGATLAWIVWPLLASLNACGSRTRRERECRPDGAGQIDRRLFAADGAGLRGRIMRAQFWTSS